MTLRTHSSFYRHYIIIPKAFIVSDSWKKLYSNKIAKVSLNQ